MTSNCFTAGLREYLDQRLAVNLRRDQGLGDFHGGRDKNGNPYNVAVETLAERGVIFDVCEITLKSRKLDRKLFIPEAKFVPSGVAEIGKLQARGGFAYIKALKLFP